MKPTRNSTVRPIANTLIRHEYVRVGDRDAPMISAGVGDVRLMWLPALMDGAASFTRVALELAGRLQGTVSVCAVDPPGYGSSAFVENERIPLFAELGVWINELLDQLSGRFILVGNSSGAVIAAMAAAERRDVLGLGLVGWCDWRLIGQPHRDLLCPTTKADLQHLLQVGWHHPPRPFPNTLAAQLGYAQRVDYREHVRSFSPDAFGKAFDRYAGPLALIAGTSDGIITPAMVQVLAARRPNARLRWIQQCGHYPHRERPEELADILTHWIEDLLPVAQRAEYPREVENTEPSVLAERGVGHPFSDSSHGSRRN